MSRNFYDEQPYVALIDRGASWQDISTAPKDGTPVLIWKPDERMVGEYMMSAYYCDNESGWIPVGGIHKQGYFSNVTNSPQGYPTHWGPMPPAPNFQ